jgi:hypothetical protein
MSADDPKRTCLLSSADATQRAKAAHALIAVLSDNLQGSNGSGKTINAHAPLETDPYRYLIDKFPKLDCSLMGIPQYPNVDSRGL